MPTGRRHTRNNSEPATANVYAATSPDDGITSHNSDCFVARVLPTLGARELAHTQNTEYPNPPTP